MSETKYCHQCGTEIIEEATTCPNCGVLQTGKSTTGELKNPGFAAILSFLIVGVGQIYNGQIGKGILLIVIQVINFIIMLFTLFLWAPVYLAVFAYAIWDAYNVAKEINEGEIVI
jgi:TM2 domain-containing membrane protein YozV